MKSLWLESSPRIPADVFQDDGQYDSVVVGAGITGLTTATLLARSGQRVAVLEARTVGAVTTGNSTAKVSLLQGTQLSSIIRHHGADLARHYVTGNREGQSWLLRFCDENSVSYDIRDGLNYAITDDGARLLSEERDACATSGLNAVLENSSELPFPVTRTLRVAGQAQVHPMQVLAALAADLRKHSGQLVEGVRVTGVKAGSTKGERSTIQTSLGEISAANVILATGTPILDRGGHFSVLQPHRSYAVAFTVQDEIPQGMYLSVDSPSRTLRNATVEGRPYLIVGGNGHTVGRQAHTQSLVDDIIRWTQEHFPTAQAAFSWSAQDYQPASSVPYVGKMPVGGQSIYAATGFNKWGFTNGVAAGLALSAEILGGHMPWAKELYKTRVGKQDALSTAKANAGVGVEMVTGWLGGLARTSHARPDEGQGVIVREGARPVGICQIAGVTHRVSAVCPHLGGVLSWNDAEQSWDCPLHGSRFSHDGVRLEGPATRDLQAP
ncbi:FAD-dependent oxidoreductase [Arthrobacter tumbae]|uniref:FAD-dependent oxidoreductase n=1 Tax=Arthrobacter tumbae TaxID=163874 RepID=UPI00195A0CE0|nr:FAD-dependent oxidoreductase [Arthrobacter tumbae]MBM7781436.1 glycine/D-amino acid oxidase-like deaminating enzyme/nitrite reductase/ring-hydroxylating ferredoxin subunit [Arthrobacter tumbae]